MTETNPHGVDVPEEIRERIEDGIRDKFSYMDEPLSLLCWHEVERGETARFAVDGHLLEAARGHTSIKLLDLWHEATDLDGYFVEPEGMGMMCVYEA